MSTGTPNIYQHFIDKHEFMFVNDAYNATNGFRDGGYIDKFPRETVEKYEARKKVAYYINDIRPAAQRFTSYLFKKPPQRDVQHPLVQAFTEDCDWRGNSLDVFMANFCQEAKVRGSMLLLVDMPRVAPSNAAEQASNRFYPYLVSIPPEKVHSYLINERGLFAEIGIESTYLENGYERYCVRWWNETSWWVTNGSDILEKGDHNLGVCPVLAFSEGISWPHIGDFAQIAHVSKRLYNLRSELDEILRSNTFSILTYHIPPATGGSINPTQVAESLGANNLLTYPGNKPEFVAAPDGPAKIYLDTIAKLEETIKEMALDPTKSTNSRSNETGIALTIRFQTLNSALLAFARKGEDLERRLFDLVSLWLGIQNTVTTTWAKDFNIADINAELLTLGSMQTCAFPEEVITQKKKQIVSLDFYNLDPEDLETLMESCDTANMTDIHVQPEVLDVEVANDPTTGLINQVGMTGGGNNQ